MSISRPRPAPPPMPAQSEEIDTDASDIPPPPPPPYPYAPSPISSSYSPPSSPSFQPVEFSQKLNVIVGTAPQFRLPPFPPKMALPASAGGSSSPSATAAAFQLKRQPPCPPPPPPPPPPMPVNMNAFVAQASQAPLPPPPPAHTTSAAAARASISPPPLPSSVLSNSNTKSSRPALPPPVSGRADTNSPNTTRNATTPTTLPKPADAKNVIEFSLSECLSLVQSDSEALALRLEAQENDLLATRAQMISISRRNFMLERELYEIDEKIKLLIKNRLTIQEVLSATSSSSTQKEQAADENVALAALKNRKVLYEDLFFLLQSTPKYFALLARLIQPQKDSVAMFVQTVVIDTFGDAFDAHEERLLLALFHSALHSEIESCSDRSTLLRSNTVITHMLSAYSKRGQGLGVLREVLEEPLKQLCENKSNRSVNFELQPLKIYQALIQDFETETGQISLLSKEVKTDEEALMSSEVQSLIDAHLRSLLHWCDLILNRILSSTKKIPYGMRWICRVLGEEYRKRFGNTGEGAESFDEQQLQFQIQALQGGFIYLRFFNPIIVAPESLDFIKEKPGRVMRRNLILIAKVLQNLSNHLLFGDKEPYMKPVNSWLESRFPLISDYFRELTHIENEEEYAEQEILGLEKYVVGGQVTGAPKRANSHPSLSLKTITMSCNQIFFLHSLLVQYKEKICLGKNGIFSAQDPLNEILQRLGPNIPGQVKREENINVELKLIDRRELRNSTITSPFNTPGHAASSSSSSNAGTIVSVHDPFQSKSSTSASQFHPLYLQAKTLLLNILKKLPAHMDSGTLTQFLSAQKLRAIEGGNHSLHDAVNNVSAMLSTLFNMKLLANRNTNGANQQEKYLYSPAAQSEKERCIDAFLYSCTLDAQQRVSAQARLEKLGKKVDAALKTVQKHEEYLKSRLEIYQVYLKNVKQGQAMNQQQEEKNSSSSFSSDRKPKSDIAFTRTLKFSHAELCAMNLIHSIEGDYSDKILKHLQYVWEMKTQTSRHLAPKFYVSVNLKKGVSIPLLAQPVEIVLEDLLRLQEHAQPYMTVDAVQLNVNVLVHFLNNQFIALIKQ